MSSGELAYLTYGEADVSTRGLLRYIEARTSHQETLGPHTARASVRGPRPAQ